uniref:Uncharacterized protein n=1 Tax=Oryza rufipogon TaxID=4529 RepID=A0A0E0NIX7_ORYRU
MKGNKFLESFCDIVHVLLGLFLRQHQTRSQSRRYDFTQRWDEMPFALALA